MKPILFNTEMVRAILEGRKTVTRRVVKLPSQVAVLQDNGLYTLFAEGTCYEDQRLEDIAEYCKKPYKVNDILYVRESYMPAGCRMCEVYECYGSCGCPDYLYKADFGENDLEEFKEDGYKWKPSIHMPKEAARIFLRVTDVRVERLQNMGKEDALKEGINPKLCVNLAHALSKFKTLWNYTLNKGQQELYSWEANPYVWVIEFERVDLDSLGGAYER